MPPHDLMHIESDRCSDSSECVVTGYPVGDQIRELGDILLSEDIQSQLPAFNFRPLSSLSLPPATVSLPLSRSSAHLVAPTKLYCSFAPRHAPGS